MYVTKDQLQAEMNLAQPVILMIGNDDVAVTRLERETMQAGVRLSCNVPPAEAVSRLEQQVMLDAVWIDWDSVAEDDALPGVIDWLMNDSFGREVRLILSVALDRLDDALGSLQREVVVLCNAQEYDRLATLAELRMKPQTTLHDVGTERKVEQLTRLSEEVHRIAHVLATLSGTDGEVAPVRPVRSSPPSPFLPSPGEEPGIIDVHTVRQLIRMRRLRNDYFRGELFADPAWDMLLDLMAAKLEHKRVAVSSLCIAADVPATTALRWIKTMTDHGLFRRVADPTDGRRIFIELAEPSFGAMKEYFRAVGRLSPFTI
jgi:hypothetical protein